MSRVMTQKPFSPEDMCRLRKRPIAPALVNGKTGGDAPRRAGGIAAAQEVIVAP